MPFPPTGSVISTDLDNMLRGLNRDNSDHAVSGPVVETTLASFSVSANTMGPTGGLVCIAVGTCIGAGGTKAIRLYLGGTALMVISVPSGNQCWFIKAWIFNTATNAQRVYVESGSIPAQAGTSATPLLTYEYEAAALDTTQNQILKVTTTNANAGDTCTQTMWDVFVVQIN